MAIKYQIRFCHVTNIDDLLSSDAKPKFLILETMQVEREDLKSPMLDLSSVIFIEGKNYNLDSRLDSYTEVDPAESTFTVCIPVVPE